MKQRETRTVAGSLKKQPIPDFMVELDRTLLSLWCCDNRLVMQLGSEGIRRVNYFSPHSPDAMGLTVLSDQGVDFLECLRPNVCIGQDRYAAEEGRLVAAPFGFYRQQRHTDDRVEVRTGVWMAEDCLILSYDVLSPRHGTALGEAVLWPSCFNDMGGRVWTAWQRRGGTWVRSGTARRAGEPPVRVCVAVAGSHGLTLREYREKIDLHGSGKYRFATRIPDSRSGYLVLAFGEDPSEAAARARRVARSVDRTVGRQFVRYGAAAKAAPRLSSASPMLDRFVALAPLYEEALKVTDMPGTHRAKTSAYWMWLWDAALPGMVDPYWSGGGHAARMARCLIRYAGPNGLVPFGLPIQVTEARKMPLPRARGDRMAPGAFNVQGLLEMLVHDASALTGDLHIVRDTYGFLRNHFRRAEPTLMAETGLIRGPSAFPDAGLLIDRTLDGVSAYNNACWYNACRKMEKLALARGDGETAGLAWKWARQVEASFWPMFWDPKEGYLSVSADGQGRRREVFASTATFLDFGYGDELCDGHIRATVAYQLRHFYSRMGISIFSPRHPDMWDRDGNQFHCSWPVMDSHNLKLALWARNREALDHFVPWVESLVSRHTVPEAIQMRVKKDFPVVYDAGAWQAYTMSSWYRVVVESLLGVMPDAGGLTCAGTMAPPMGLEGLHYRGGLIDITTTGCGWDVLSLELDGRKLVGACKIAAHLLEGGRHRLRIVRGTARGGPLHVLGANGASVDVVKSTPGRLAFTVRGAGLTRVKLQAGHLRRVTVEGQRVAVRRGELPHTYWIELNLPFAGLQQVIAETKDTAKCV
jgi:hypothetical protein